LIVVGTEVKARWAGSHFPESCFGNVGGVDTAIPTDRSERRGPRPAGAAWVAGFDPQRWRSASAHDVSERAGFFCGCRRDASSVATGISPPGQECPGPSARALPSSRELGGNNHGGPAFGGGARAGKCPRWSSPGRIGEVVQRASQSGGDRCERRFGVPGFVGRADRAGAQNLERGGGRSGGVAWAWEHWTGKGILSPRLRFISGTLAPMPQGKPLQANWPPGGPFTGTESSAARMHARQGVQVPDKTACCSRSAWEGLQPHRRQSSRSIRSKAPGDGRRNGGEPVLSWSDPTTPQHAQA